MISIGAGELALVGGLALALGFAAGLCAECLGAADVAG